MNFRRIRRLEEPEINFIPLIDVMLVILIFLMATTTYSRFSELKISLPVAQAEAVQNTANEIHVTIDAQNHYLLNRQATAFDSPTAFAVLLLKAAGTRKDPVVIIDADSKAAYQSVVNVMEAARLAGLSRLTFSTQNPADTAP